MSLQTNRVSAQKEYFSLFFFRQMWCSSSPLATLLDNRLNSKNINLVDLKVWSSGLFHGMGVFYFDIENRRDLQAGVLAKSKQYLSRDLLLQDAALPCSN